jgi:Flp pilus assembly pilin Flp
MKLTKLLERLRSDQEGVVSFEYVVVAACITAVAIAVLFPAANGPLEQALVGAINTIGGAVASVVGG